MFISLSSLSPTGAARPSLWRVVIGLVVLVAAILPAGATTVAPGLGIMASIQDAGSLFDAVGLAVSPTSADLYVLAEDTVSHYRRDPTTGYPTRVAVYVDGADGIVGLVDGRVVAVAPDGAQVYVGSRRGLLVFARDATSGALTFRELLPRGAISAIAVSPNGAQVYLASYWDDAITVLARNATSGALTQVQVRTNGVGTVRFLGGPRALAFSPDGLWLYAASEWSDAIAVFSRDAGTGRLTWRGAHVEGVAGAVGLTEPRALTLSADGTQLFVTSPWSDALTVWTRSVTNGVLTAPSQFIDGELGVAGLSGAGAVALDEGGEALYVRGEDALVAFARSTTTGGLNFNHAYLDGAGGIGGLSGGGSVLPVGSQIYLTSDQGDVITVLSPLVANGGGLAGRVSAQAGGWVGNIDVNAYRLNAGISAWQQVRSTRTDGAGTYTLAGLAPATYRVCFAGAADGHYLPECFNNAVDVAHANGVAVAANATRTGINAVLAERHLSGRVTNTTGTPLSEVTVTVGIWREDAELIGNWVSSTSVTTGADGSFDLGGLADASYRVCFSHPAHADTCGDGVLRDAVLDIQLAAAGHLVGTVTKDGGGALQEIAVWAFVRATGSSEWRPVTRGITSATGRYDLRLGSGTYRICFYSRYHLPECYRNAADVETATNVALTVGQTKTGINAQLTPVGRIAGRVTAPDGVAAEATVNVYRPFVDNGGNLRWDWIVDGETDRDGNYDLGKLAGGRYWVCFEPPWDEEIGGRLYARECYNDKPYLSLAAPPENVSVVPGTTTGHVDAAFKRPGSISGRVTDSSGTGVSNILVSVGHWIDRPNGSYYSFEAWARPTGPDGAYQLGGLAEGNYQVCFDAGYANPYLSECWNDKPYMSRSETVAVTSGRDTSNTNAILYRKAADAYEPDDTQVSAVPITSGQTQARSLYRANGTDQDWASFTLTRTSVVRLETLASTPHDLRLYNPSQMLDWSGAIADGQVLRATIQRESCTVNALSAGNYFVSINQYDTFRDPRYTLSYRSAPCAANVDTDGDGLVNTLDNCIFDANATQANQDGDYLGDACDADDDNDGVSDFKDSNPLDPAAGGAVVALPLNRVDTAQHGWGWGDRAYRTTLAATFTGDGGDRLLHVQGYDLDSASELALWLNGKRLGYLTATANNAMGTGGLWWLPATAQISGVNRIEFRQKTAGEAWGVTQLGLYAPGAAFGNLTSALIADRAHGGGFELHFPKVSAGYLLGLSGYDSDTDNEIQLQLNDAALVDLPQGTDAAWTTRYQLLLPGSWLRSGDNRLLIKNRGAATEDWGLRLDGLRPFGSNLGFLTSIPGPLQFSDHFNLLIAPAATASVLDYRCYDTATEVRRVLDGNPAGTCPASGPNTWSADQRLAVSGGVRHVLTFDNTLNPPGTDPWAVKLLAWLVDTDADSVPDSSDNCPSVANLDQANLDGDTDGDLCDTDLDGDGYANAVDAFPRDQTEWRDTDGDGTGDTADLDDDGDGFADAIDPDPLDAGKVPPARIGVWRPGTRAVILDRDGSLSADTSETTAGPLGASTDLPISGDWNGDGTDELGFYRPSNHRFYLDWDGNGRWNSTLDRSSVAFGALEAVGDVPVIGDWDGDGADEIGTYNPTTRQFTLDLDGSLSPTGNDLTTAAFGAAGDLPLSGDWNGDGRDTVGVRRPGTRKFLLDSNGNGQWDGTAGGDTLTSAVGVSADLPVCGDWNGDGTDEVGVYRPSELRFYLDSNGSNSLTADDLTSGPFGLAGDLPVAGRW